VSATPQPDSLQSEIAALRKKLPTLPLWNRAQILAELSAKTGEPIYEIERALREHKKR
jgi:hypothetical protein